VVHNGQEALKFLKGSIDGTLCLVVMDWHLPDVNGYLIAQKVRSEPRYSGVDFLIGASGLQPDDTMLMQELDILHTLPKGASQQHIVEKVRAIQNDTGRLPRALKLRKELEIQLQNGNLQEATALLNEPELKKELQSNARNVHLLGEFETHESRVSPRPGAASRPEPGQTRDSFRYRKRQPDANLMRSSSSHGRSDIFEARNFA
jgi:DNA-binding response OmpR family regulator